MNWRTVEFGFCNSNWGSDFCYVGGWILYLNSYCDQRKEINWGEVTAFHGIGRTAADYTWACNDFLTSNFSLVVSRTSFKYFLWMLGMEPSIVVGNKIFAYIWNLFLIMSSYFPVSEVSVVSLSFCHPVSHLPRESVGGKDG